MTDQRDATMAGAFGRELAGRLDALRASDAYRNYLWARESVMRMKDAEPDHREGIAAPSAYWWEELSNFEYLLDASPLVIEKLRHHTYHVTGLRVYDYRTDRAEGRRKFENKLGALRKRGRADLFVPEHRALGGFGFDVDGGLVNLDTLKYYEVLVALDRGAVLDEFQSSETRPLLWEIGAGWGGFAYQFKKLFPNLTYVISDFPELFLFSATYLLTVCPGSTACFVTSAAEAADSSRWLDHDFVFVPNTLLGSFAPPRLDLTINIVSFQEMTTDQVQSYTRKAFDLQCPFLYSLNRERSPYNRELKSVTDVVSRFYWPHFIDILPVSYQKMLDEEPSETDYKHLVGWRRVQPA